MKKGKKAMLKKAAAGCTALLLIGGNEGDGRCRASRRRKLDSFTGGVR